MTPPLNFHGTKVHFVRLLIISFWTSCDLPHGFQSQNGSLTCTPTCLHAVNLRIKSGTTLAFSTNRSVNCISKYTAGLPSRHPPWVLKPGWMHHHLPSMSLLLKGSLEPGQGSNHEPLTCRVDMPSIWQWLEPVTVTYTWH